MNYIEFYFKKWYPTYMKNLRDDITEFIFLQQEPGECDAIFCAGTSYPHIPERAAELFARGLAPFVFVGGAYSITKGHFTGVRAKADVYTGSYGTEAEFYTDVLVKNGVPLSAILAEHRSTYTKQNAVFARELADGRGLGIKRAMLVCQEFHARRCSMYYQLAFPDTELIPVPVSCDGITRENWAQSDYGISRVMGEVRRIGEQFTPEELCALLQKKQG